MAVKISALPNTQTSGKNDLLEIAVVDSASPTGYSSKSISVGDLIPGGSDNPYFEYGRFVGEAEITHYQTPIAFSEDGISPTISIALAPLNGGAILAEIPGETVSSRGMNAIDLQRSRNADDQVAAGYNSIILNGENNSVADAFNTILTGGNLKVSGFASSILTGSDSVMSSANSSGIALFDSTVTDSSYNFMGMGYQSVLDASIFSSIVGGANQTVKNSGFSVVVGGQNNKIETESPYNSVLGGSTNVIGGPTETGFSIGFSTILGGSQNKITVDTAGISFSAIVSGSDNNIRGEATASIIGTGYSNVVSGKYANGILAGQFNQLTDGDSGAILAGNGNTLNASGQGNIILGGSSNTMSGTTQTSSIVSGVNNQINNSSMSTIGGMYNNISDGLASTAFGNNNQLTGYFNTAFGTGNTITTGQCNLILGSNGNNRGADYTQTFSFDSGAQVRKTVSMIETPNATPVTLLQTKIPRNSTYAFSGKLVARTLGNDYAVFEFTGAANRDATGTVTFSTTTVTQVYATTAAGPWTTVLEYEPIEEVIQVRVTGNPATNIKWMVEFITTEIVS